MSDNDLTPDFIDAINKLVDKALDENKEREVKELCPVCGAEVVIVARCRTCYSCGWSTCSL